MKKPKHIFKQGEYAYFTPTCEIVEIIGSVKKEGWIRNRTNIRVLSPNNIDPLTGKPLKYYDCNVQVLQPILDDSVQFLFKMLYKDEKFTVIRHL